MMKMTKLYKYLDATGALKMLEKGTLQFTNATKLNDPFDCHPSLIDFSDIPAGESGGPNVISLWETQPFKYQLEKTWICCLSKVNDSLLMWNNYGRHKGVCIGLDMEKADKYLSEIQTTTDVGVEPLEVQYKAAIEKPDFQNFFRYQLSTKASELAYEKEVRLLLLDPSPVFTKMVVPPHSDDDHGWKDLLARPSIGGECFCSLRLGVNIDEFDRERLIKVARNLNPDIKIYQMVRDLESFRLIAEPV